MTRFTTPLDDFMADVAMLLNQPWYVWAGVGVAVAVVVGVVALVKWRSRVLARTPQYRRSTDRS